MASASTSFWLLPKNIPISNQAQFALSQYHEDWFGHRLVAALNQLDISFIANQRLTL